jgi:hypothetical protein
MNMLEFDWLGGGAKDAPQFTGECAAQLAPSLTSSTQQSSTTILIFRSKINY